MSNISPWNLYDLDPPWENRPSLFRHVHAHLELDAIGLVEGGDNLPDERSVRSKDELTFAPGARDGILLHHTQVPGTAKHVAGAILKALHELLEETRTEHAAALYSLLAAHSALECYLPLLQTIFYDPDLDQDRLYQTALWLATEAPDREPVKAAIAILGLYSGGEEKLGLLRILGRHEEFTFFTAMALWVEANAEQELWELAQHVTGWGRIHIVDRLAHTQNERIRAWMLREGYRNRIIYEYTACTCATGGDLLGALSLPTPDEALLTGAGDILQALIDGRWEPAKGIYDYVDAVPATELWLEHLQKRNANTR